MKIFCKLAFVAAAAFGDLIGQNRGVNNRFMHNLGVHSANARIQDATFQVLLHLVKEEKISDAKALMRSMPKRKSRGKGRRFGRRMRHFLPSRK